MINFFADLFGLRDIVKLDFGLGVLGVNEITDCSATIFDRPFRSALSNGKAKEYSDATDKAPRTKCWLTAGRARITLEFGDANVPILSYW